MTTTSYINSNGLGLKVTQLPSGAFDLYFSNGFTSTCYTEDELQDLIQRKAFRNVDHIHESSANQIGRSNYGGRVSVSPQSGNGIKKAENRTRRSIH